MKLFPDFLKHGKHALALFLVLGSSKCLEASTASDIASPSQAVRDAAAKVLRESWVAPSRTNWDSLLAKLKVGTPETNAMQLLSAYTNNVEGAGGNGVVEWHRYRLDDVWLIDCSFGGESSNRVLLHRDLLKQMQPIAVQPPTDYTGVWTIYYVNGQEGGKVHFKHGQPEGESVGFYSDGSKMTINHSLNGVLEGKATSYYPSGKVKYVGQYHTNAPVGVWTWYKEDGSIESKRDFGKP